MSLYKKHEIKIHILLWGFILLVSLLPVYRLAMYATPYYDDYSFAKTVKIMWEENPTVKTVIDEALWVVKNVFFSWQGTYSSVFLMALMPATFGNQYYFVGIFAIITMLVAGTFFFVYTLCACFDKKKDYALLVSEIATIFVLQYYYSAQQGIYWYNGSLHYTFMHSLMLVMLGVVLRVLYAEKTVTKVLLCVAYALLAFIVAGSNFVTALQGILLLLVLLFAGFRKGQRNLYGLIPGTLIYIAGMLANMLAPGNARRAVWYETVAKGPVESILYSFKSGFELFGQFTGFRMLVPMIILAPVFWKMLGNEETEGDGKFLLPGLVTVLSFCFFCTGFTPSYYGMGHPGLARTFCSIKVTLMLLIFVNEYYWMGWIKNKVSGEKKMGRILSALIPAYIVAAVVMVVSFALSNNQAGNYLSYGSYYYVHTGEALNYYNEQQARDEIIRNSGDVVELSPLVWRPWFLCKNNELSTNPEAEQNRAMADWYGKSQIYLSEE